SQPYSLAVGPDGNIWFTDTANSQIGRVTLQGQITLFPTLTPDSIPVGITAGPGNTLWFTEEGANKLGKFNIGKFNIGLPPVPNVVLRDASGNAVTTVN